MGVLDVSTTKRRSLVRKRLRAARSGACFDLGVLAVALTFAHFEVISLYLALGITSVFFTPTVATFFETPGEPEAEHDSKEQAEKATSEMRNGAP